MKRNVLFLICLLWFVASKEQVTQINANKSLTAVTVLNATSAIFESEIDSSIWVSNGTMAGTTQISDTIKYVGYGALLNGKFIFKGWSPKCGKEIFITDGTKAGTKLIKDINSGIASSQPVTTTMAVLGNYVYFAALTPTEGCELWRTDGTSANTVIVKDIVAGATSGIDSLNFNIISTGSLLLLGAKTAANGNELWSSGGTSATTSLLRDINAGAISSNPRGFFPLGNIYLFTITSSTPTTTQIWKTDGTAAGTVLIKDQIAPPSGIVASSINVFHIFKSKAYFIIDDGVHTGDALYNTDGADATSAHTAFIKDLGTQTFVSSLLLADAMNLSNKFIFPYSDGSTIFSLLQSDGTSAGTTTFKSFPVNTNGDIPFIYTSASYNAQTQTIINPLFNGKFYFSGSDANGNELWMSDGTVSTMVKDIYSGAKDGISSNSSWLFATTGLFFAADNGTNGDELWKTDGTVTSMVQDIYPSVHNADPELYFINNGKIFFSAVDGTPADTTIRDLYVVNGTFVALPVNLLDFTVVPKGDDALLQWSTVQETNSRNFIIQSSTDAQDWKILGTVAALGNSSVKNQYSFTDFGIMNSGNKIVYYRLVQNDMDGNAKNSDIISLRIKNSQPWNIQLFSNPAHDHLKVLLTGVNGSASLSIHDLAGKEMYKKQMNQSGMISIPLNMQPGVYILYVSSGNWAQSFKFVKE